MGSIPITSKNIQMISEIPEVNTRSTISNHSANAGLSIIGFRSETLKHDGPKLFDGFEEMGNILFVNAHSQKEI